MNIGYRFRKRWLFAVVFLVFFIQLLLRMVQDIKDSEVSHETAYDAVLSHSIRNFSPLMPYVSGDWEKGDLADQVWQLFYRDMPLEECARKETGTTAAVREYMQETPLLAKIEEKDEKRAEEAEENAVSGEYAAETDHPVPAAEAGTESGAGSSFTETESGISLEEAVLAENTAAAGGFVPVQAPVAVYSRQQLEEPGFIKGTFYSEDATTYVRDDQLDYNTLMGFDATLKQDSSKVQILVYHTHSQEAYADSVPGDPSTSVVGVGEHLCEILRTQYGFNVMHHLGEYDVESRDYAYSNAMVGLEQVLAENPTIEVMIDLHRDATNADTRLVTTVQDKTTAKFMFFNGLCYTRALGALDNLPNPYVQDNLSFAFQMQLAAEEYYPGLTRRIYLKGYRYNLHYRPKSLLIELGSQTNTVEEAMNACEPMAHVISMVLRGENKNSIQ